MADDKCAGCGCYTYRGLARIERRMEPHEFDQWLSGEDICQCGADGYDEDGEDE